LPAPIAHSAHPIRGESAEKDMSEQRPEKPEVPGDDDRHDRGLMPMWRLSSIGIEMGVAVLVGYVIGHFLDKWVGSEPWLTIVFVVLGVAAGFKGMIAAARDATADAKRKEARKGQKK
jgi:ATP synthase protein I